MASKNKNLSKAKTNKNDEFYTQLSDIENELVHYKEYFKGKTVLCNCDDPFESNFFKYFVLSFNHLGLKKLICTSYAGSPVAGIKLQYDIDKNGQMSFVYDENGLPAKAKRRAYKAVINVLHDATGDGAIMMDDVAELFKTGENQLTELEGDGDFRSEECIELLKEADIVCTNPPFSLFREYVSQLMGYKKEFIIIGNINAITYREFFPLLKNNEVWMGVSIHSGDRKFNIPDYYETTSPSFGIDPDGRHYVRVPGVRWFTNLDHRQRHEDIICFRNYDPETYQKYDNYDAINVNKVIDIPCDYTGVMGVPISFMDKYCPEQFEIIGDSQRGCHDERMELRRYDDFWEMKQDGTRTGSSGNKTNGNPNLEKNDKKHNYFINDEGKMIQSTYNRIFIRFTDSWIESHPNDFKNRQL